MLRVTVAALLAATASAYVQTPARLGSAKLALSKAAFSRATAAPAMSLAPVPAAVDGAFASTVSTAMGLEVNGGAFLAVILGVLVPVIFLIIIFIKVRDRARTARRGRAHAADRDGCVAAGRAGRAQRGAAVRSLCAARHPRASAHRACVLPPRPCRAARLLARPGLRPTSRGADSRSGRVVASPHGLWAMAGLARAQRMATGGCGTRDGVCVHTTRASRAKGRALVAHDGGRARMAAPRAAPRP